MTRLRGTNATTAEVRSILLMVRTADVSDSFRTRLRPSGSVTKTTSWRCDPLADTNSRPLSTVSLLSVFRAASRRTNAEPVKAWMRARTTSLVGAGRCRSTKSPADAR
eukprot:Amastigsp_a347551_18.p2 type:complete len:108 gc:universal Amastigsp_a347551_18:239-562(+)